MEHTFTATIKLILANHYNEQAEDIYNNSLLLQYINFKTKSANKGSKARGSFASLYAVYVLIEDYISQGYHERIDYNSYKGANFTDLLKRARQLPFGEKIQNHAFNNRVNKEFSNKYFTESPVIINTDKRYWINENLVKVKPEVNIAPVLIEIIDTYVKTKQDSFNRFLEATLELSKLEVNKNEVVEAYIFNLLAPNVDARLFEIVSYSILKYSYKDVKLYWGYSLDHLKEDHLQLFKTGRTNANDGGIDFVMKPLGRFFQVTETLDFKKYFLDIDKIKKVPMSFVIKSEKDSNEIYEEIKKNAIKDYVITEVVERYLECIEEIINIPSLREHFKKCIEQNYLNLILDEIIIQSRLEFNVHRDND